MVRRDFVQYSSMWSGILVVDGEFSPISKSLREPVDELPSAGAMQIKGANRTCKISTVEVNRMMLDRFDRFHSNLNPIVYLIREEALATARHAAEELKRGNNLVLSLVYPSHNSYSRLPGAQNK